MKSLLLSILAIILLTTEIFSQTVPSYVPTNGLAGYWPFNGNANDESGKSTTGGQSPVK